MTSPRFVAEASSNHGQDLERAFGFVEAAAELAPFPVVIMLPGINVGGNSGAAVLCNHTGIGPAE